MIKLNTNQLKYIAIIAMTIDHIAFTFVMPYSLLYYIMRSVGRLTAPIMCFLISEGFTHTKSRKKYLFRLLMFAIISQPFYYYFVFKAQPKSVLHFITNLNVIFNLAVALSCLIILKSRLKPTYKYIICAVAFSLSEFGDWSYMIPIWTMIFFFLKEKQLKRNITFIVVSVPLLMLLFLKNYDSFLHFSYSFAVILSLVPISLYNGQKSKEKSPLKKKFNKWFFYIYYPLHQLLITIAYIVCSTRYLS